MMSAFYFARLPYTVMSHIITNHLTLEYPNLETASALGWGSSTLRKRQSREPWRALDDITFHIKPGERIALVGPNGAGKSTLLRVFAGILEPTSGTINVSGKLTSMLDWSFGLNTELSGYENIFLRGAYMGLRRADMEPMVDDIIAFSGLGDRVYGQIKTYSAGMMARLAFSISTSMEPDILLLDEWISAGDKAFIAQTEKRMNDLVSRSGIVVLATHNEALITHLRMRPVMLDKGRLVNV